MPGAVIYISEFQNKLAWKFGRSVSTNKLHHHLMAGVMQVWVGGQCLERRPRGGRSALYLFLVCLGVDKLRVWEINLTKRP